jgi:hypothetical protein
MDRVGSNSEKQFNNGLLLMILEAERQVCNTVLRRESFGFGTAGTHFPLPIFPSSIQPFWILAMIEEERLRGTRREMTSW